MKLCSKCKAEKPLFHFSQHPWGDGRRPDCKECVSARSRRRAKLLGTMEMTSRKHRITAKDYKKIFATQDNRCAICKNEPGIRGRSFAIDHNHITDTVRGILCPRCNGGLGMFRDNPVLLLEAAKYIKFWGME